jgi:hypothetical protein
MNLTTTTRYTVKLGEPFLKATRPHSPFASKSVQPTLDPRRENVRYVESEEYEFARTVNLPGLLVSESKIKAAPLTNLAPPDRALPRTENLETEDGDCLSALQMPGCIVRPGRSTTPATDQRPLADFQAVRENAWTDDEYIEAAATQLPGLLTVSQERVTVADSEAPHGLCVDCIHRETCAFPRPHGGVWRCEEYA